MSVEIVMPKFGMTMTKGTITKWLKDEGEFINKGEPLLEISTDKIINEIDSPASGYLGQILIKSGETVPVGTLIAVIVAEEPKYNGDSAVTRQSEGDTPLANQTKEIIKSKIKASPKAKKIARDAGIDLQVIVKGQAERIVAQDVEDYLKTMKEAALTPQQNLAENADETIPLEGMRKIIADRMKASYSEKPHVTLNTQVQVKEFLQLLDTVNGIKKDELTKISFNDLLVKAVGIALTKHRYLNGVVEANCLIRRGEINIGVAVALEEGLIVPVIHNADKLSLSEIALRTKDLLPRARKKELSPDELQGGTFTVSNLGMFGIDSFTPIINAPEIAILGVGRINEAPIVVEGNFIAVPTMQLCLSFDHRAIDGAQAALFVRTLRSLIEVPQILWTF